MSAVHETIKCQRDEVAQELQLLADRIAESKGQLAMLLEKQTEKTGVLREFDDYLAGFA